jgi:rhodanese-related sulfurtransferase
MIRSFLKDKARQAAIRILNMEYDTVDRDPSARKRGDPTKFDPSKIPKLVDGDGDTPGPNHKEDIGRTFASAQITGGKGFSVLDIRTPLEVVGGLLPGAVLMPRDGIKTHLDRLPEDRTFRVLVYDQTGEHGSVEIAAWLRENGWPWARRLKGGYAEWIEHGEVIVPPHSPEGASKGIGDPVRLADGQKGWVLEIDDTGDALTYRVWLESGEFLGPFSEDELDCTE